MNNENIFKKEFKVGDNVYLIDGSGVHNLEFNVSYKNVEIEEHTNYTGTPQTMLALEGIENEEPITYHKYQFFNSRRFINDIRPIRKKKLQKIYETYK